MKPKFHLVCFTALLLSSTAVHADITWIGSAGGDFFDSANWDDDIGPDPDNNAATPYLGGNIIFAGGSAVGGKNLLLGTGLSLTVTNTTGSALTSFLDSGVTVYSASVVPEPGTYALLFAGLAAVGFVVRRKSQSA